MHICDLSPLHSQPQLHCVRNTAQSSRLGRNTMNATTNIHNLLLITFLLLSQFSCCCSQLQCQQCVAQRFSNHHQLCFSSVCQKCLIAILISCRWKLEKWRDTSCILFCGFSKCCLVKESEVVN